MAEAPTNSSPTTRAGIPGTPERAGLIRMFSALTIKVTSSPIVLEGAFAAPTPNRPCAVSAGGAGIADDALDLINDVRVAAKNVDEYVSAFDKSRWYQRNLKDLFDSYQARNGITIGDVSYLHDGSEGGAKVFHGVSEPEIFAYFESVTGRSITNARLIERPKGKIYVVETPEGNFNLRDFDTSGTGAKWTIDVPGKLLGSAKGSELKFK